jgi:hypothetical protein
LQYGWKANQALDMLQTYSKLGDMGTAEFVLQEVAEEAVDEAAQFSIPLL